MPRFSLRSKIIAPVAVGLLAVAGLSAPANAGLVPDFEETIDAVSARRLARALLFCAIWLPYILLSTRVKNTFAPALRIRFNKGAEPESES